eukprot:jgi/Hompol1/6947/HPOL_000979-RA
MADKKNRVFSTEKLKDPAPSNADLDRLAASDRTKKRYSEPPKRAMQQTSAPNIGELQFEKVGSGSLGFLINSRSPHGSAGDTLDPVQQTAAAGQHSRSGNGGNGGNQQSAGANTTGGSTAAVLDESEMMERMAKYKAQRRSRISVSLRKVKERTIKHINQFIRIQVQFRDGKTFPLMVDRTQTIEYITHQIEAEYTIRYMIPTSQRVFSEGDLLSSIASDNGFTPLMQISQLYDAGNMGMPFLALVGDVLVFDDVVKAITTDEVAPDLDDDEDLDMAHASSKASSIQAFSRDEMQSVFDLTNSNKTQADAKTSSQTNNLGGKMMTHSKSVNFDDRLQSVLHNIISLQFFNEFCLQEYSIENTLFWIEVEIFKTISDPSVRFLFAQYLYLTYISEHNAPLQLNLSAEVRNDIKWPIEEPVDTSVFEEAQDHAYAMIKGHAYIRYEESKIFEKFLEFKQMDRYTYIQGRVMWSFDTMFPEPSSLFHIQEAVNILMDPNSPVSAQALSEFGNKDISSIESILFRHCVLGVIIGRYFPLVSPVIREYFNTSNRNSWADRQRRIQKEKKLTKFFGHRPTTEHMMQQRIYDLREDESTDDLTQQMGGVMGSNRALRDLDDQEAKAGSDGDEQTGNDPTKRKKAGKLTEFFGESRLPKKQLKRQGGDAQASAGGAADDDDDDGTYHEAGKQSQYSIPLDDDAPILGMQNELTTAERRALNRRARKLHALLGEALDERTVSDKVTMPVVHLKTQSTERVHDIPGAQLAKQDSHNSLLQMIGASTHESGGTGDANYQGAPQIGSLGSAENEFANRFQQKLKIDKLSHFLGHRIQEIDILEAQATAPKSPPRARPLTTEEKKHYQKKSSKLERVLGSTMPAEAIVNYSSPTPMPLGQQGKRGDGVSASGSGILGEEGGSDTPFKSLLAICFDTLAATNGLEAGDPPRSTSEDVLGSSSPATTRPRRSKSDISKGHHAGSGTFDARHAAQASDGSRRSEASLSPHNSFIDDDQAEKTRKAKLQRLNKLRKMLGADIQVDRVIEQQYIEMIEKSIRDSVDDPEERRAMTEDLHQLKNLVESKTELQKSTKVGGIVQAAKGRFGSKAMLGSSEINSPSSPNLIQSKPSQ